VGTGLTSDEYRVIRAALEGNLKQVGGPFAS
jgi:hypothetical protein